MVYSSRDLLYVFPCVILFLCFSVLLVLPLPCLGKRELILVLFVRLFGLCLFGFVGFLFHLGSGKGCGLWLWHSLDLLPFFFFFFFFFFFTVWRYGLQQNLSMTDKQIFRTKDWLNDVIIGSAMIIRVSVSRIRRFWTVQYGMWWTMDTIVY